METKKNNKWLIWGLIGFTVILLATAVVLFFQLKQPVPVPTPKPKASAEPVNPEVMETIPAEVCSISFTVAGLPSPSPSVTPSPSPSVTPSPTVSPSPSPSPSLIACFDTCSNDAECEEDLRCLEVGGTKRCVNPTCPEDADCVCAEDRKVCWDKCQNDNDCDSRWSCLTVPGTNDKRCVNSACVSDSDCICSQTYASPSPVVVAQASPRAEQPVLPEAGVNTPMVLGISAGVLMMIFGLLFF